MTSRGIVSDLRRCIVDRLGWLSLVPFLPTVGLISNKIRVTSIFLRKFWESIGESVREIHREKTLVEPGV